MISFGAAVIGFVIFLGMLFLAIPVAISIFFTCFLAAVIYVGLPSLTTFGSTAWSTLNNFILTAIPLFIIRRSDQLLVGAITLDNIRRGPAQTATIGYWTGEPYIRQGFMGDALPAVVYYAFETLDLSRIEAACLPKNLASRRVLEKSGFKYEGVAQSYLQISGRWRNHVLYANLRNDRRGKSIAG